METLQPILDYVVPIILIPLATQLSKKILKIENNFFKAATVAIFAFALSYLMRWIYGLAIPIEDVVKIALQYAFVGIIGWEGYKAILKK